MVALFTSFVHVCALRSGVPSPTNCCAAVGALPAAWPGFHQTKDPVEYMTMLLAMLLLMPSPADCSAAAAAPRPPPPPRSSDQGPRGVCERAAGDA